MSDSRDREVPIIELRAVRAEELADFGTRQQRAFTDGAIAGFGYDLDVPIPSDEEVRESLQADGADILQVVSDGRLVGGAVVSFGEDGQTNSLDTFFIDGDGQGKGLGLAAWKAIEARYPRTRVWTTMTPYFDTRNIHFYVNKCGFRIVEFFHPGHREPLAEDEQNEDEAPPQDGTDRMFAFEKVMPGGGELRQATSGPPSFQ